VVGTSRKRSGNSEDEHINRFNNGEAQAYYAYP